MMYDFTMFVQRDNGKFGSIDRVVVAEYRNNNWRLGWSKDIPIIWYREAWIRLLLHQV